MPWSAHQRLAAAAAQAVVLVARDLAQGIGDRGQVAAAVIGKAGGVAQGIGGVDSSAGGVADAELAEY